MCRIWPRVTRGLATSSLVLNPLQLVKQPLCCPSRKPITAVQATDDKSQNSRFAGFVTDVQTHLCNPAKIVVAGSDRCRDLITSWHPDGCSSSCTHYASCLTPWLHTLPLTTDLKSEVMRKVQKRQRFCRQLNDLDNTVLGQDRTPGLSTISTLLVIQVAYSYRGTMLKLWKLY